MRAGESRSGQEIDAVEAVQIELEPEARRAELRAISGECLYIRCRVAAKAAAATWETELDLLLHGDELSPTKAGAADQLVPSRSVKAGLRRHAPRAQSA